MAQGWIRAYSDEYRFFKDKTYSRKDKSFFRKDFTTSFHLTANENAAVLKTLHWGDELILPDGIGSDDWTRGIVDGQEGFLKRWHVVEIGYLAKDVDDNKTPYTSRLQLSNNEYRKDLLWGDLIQITKRENDLCSVRARGWFGKLSSHLISETALLNINFIDVGQGDGVLIRFPEGRHMLLDGGLPRANQQTGKNGADFVDWKFFFDYGHYKIQLDSMMASHCDSDHYGGLWDLVKKDPETDLELDCIDLKIGEFHHAGLSTWVDKGDTHKDGLGPTKSSHFTRLLNDRQDAISCLDTDNQDTLSGHWKSFLKDIIEELPETTFNRVGVTSESLKAGQDLPEIWPNTSDCKIKVLAPVTKNVDGQPALKDLGNSGVNKNGHSICLRLNYHNAQILLTGDLNKASMDFISEAYGDRISSFNCDVAKACHHGSHDISYKFLQHINAGATIISSGDAEGYAHPRPEVVAASAVTGHVDIDPVKDRLVTPLVYMTEIERSVSLGKVTHIKMRNFHDGSGNVSDKALLALNKAEISKASYLSTDEKEALNAIQDLNEKKAHREALEEREKTLLETMELESRQFETRNDFHFKTVHQLFTISYATKPLERSRILTKNHYGLVNVRTDGETIMCATMEEEGAGWTIHTFPARF